ncbi:MAG: hypothetical protein R3360_01555, partial [Alphaproteobacteria bacterium]|nr:hypothetical protein [Alphaproteobacteria bacterium]
RAAPFVATTWLQQNAQTDPHYWQRAGTELACDAAGCVAELGHENAGTRIAIANGPQALEEDCWRADILISKVPLRQYCPQPVIVIDRFDLWREGAHAISLSGSGEVTVKTVAQSQGRRPWSLYARRTAGFSTGAED